MIKTKNMKRVNVILFSFLIAFFCGVSCNKASPYKPVDSEILRYFNYQVGSYWIYRDSLTGNIDSFVVFENGTVNSGHDKVVAIDLHEYHNSIYNDTISWEISLSENTFHLGCFILRPSQLTEPVCDVYFPYAITYATFPINGVNYNNVFENYQNPNSVFYINHDDGILKMRVPVNDTNLIIWELVRCNVKI